jgi:hypothetical protein
MDPPASFEAALRPWTEVPEQVADYLAESLPGTAEEIVGAMQAEIPAYRQPLEGAFGDDALRSVRLVLDQFVVLVREGESDLGSRRGLFKAFGREEVRAGRSLEALLAAYRIGARLAWRRTREAAQQAGLDTETMSLLAEATFAYIDELSAVSAEGYAEEHSAQVGELERRRAGLVRLLTGPTAPESTVLEERAAAARWPRPRTVAALIWQVTEGEHLAHRVPQGTLVAALDGLGCALIPDAEGPGRRAEVNATVGERSAVLGPTVALREAGRSFRRAVETHRLVLRSLLPDHGLVVAEEHLGDVLLHHSPDLLADLSERALAPLDGLSEKTRARLTKTLLAWLELQGNVTQVARTMHVHPQTVRYRLRQLRERFGSSLDDRKARFELLLVLRGSLGDT